MRCTLPWGNIFIYTYIYIPIQYFSALASTELCLYDSELSLESKNSSIIVSLYALHALLALLSTNNVHCLGMWIYQTD